MKKKIFIISSIIVGIIILVLIFNFTLDFVYANKFYPGIKIAGAKIGGLTKDSAEKIFLAKINDFSRDGQEFNWGNKYIKIYPTAISTTDPDLSRELIDLNLEKSLTNAYSLGRGQNLLDSIWQKIKFIFIKKNLDFEFDYSENEIISILQDNFSEYEKPVQNPSFEFGSKINLTDGRNGLAFDYLTATEKFKTHIANLNFNSISLELFLAEPKVIKEQAKFLLPEVESILSLAPIKITGTTTANRIFSAEITTSNLQDWLEIDYNQIKKIPELSFNSEKVANWLSLYAHNFYAETREAKFKMENNRVTEFTGSQIGSELDVLNTLEEFKTDILKNKNNSSHIFVKKTYPETSTGELNDLGINELIGQGSSNYYGSPVNRRHNIKTGADSLNGLLIKPGEEFSTNSALGEITAARGYLPELVIKGSETIPEYGGGLCQIATTLFRMAINSGMEITARKPHAYRVSYYEPAGTDATIYSPWPDFRFKNNTNKYLLLQTRVYPETSTLVFELWGTSDGRQVATTSPAIYNIVSPGPTKYIETTDLAPGKTRCTEMAHNGADAHFTRTITYPEGSDKENSEETFESHYRPWQAVCLVGVDPSKMATSTPEIIE